MSDHLHLRPRLFTSATDAKALIARFRGWPDQLLTPAVLTQISSKPNQLDPAILAQLQREGLLRSTPAGLRFSLPVDATLPTVRWSEELSERLTDHQGALRSAAVRLRKAWQHLDGQTFHPGWDDIAHSLLVSYMLWVVGGSLLRRQFDAAVLAVVVTNPETSQSIWPSFIRVNGRFGVSHLLGRLYAQSEAVDDLLRSSDTSQALSSVDANHSLLVTHPRALSVIIGLSGANSEPDGRGLRQVTWPVLSAAELRQCSGELRSFCDALRALIEQALPETIALEASSTGLLPSDLAMAAYACLVYLIAEDWLRAGLLPPVHTLRLNHLLH